MESIVPLTAPTQTPTYRRYSVFHQQDTAPVAKLLAREFFYIGKNTRSIDYLVNLFDGGYAAETGAKAMNILKRIEQQKRSYPQVFIIDSGVPLPTVAELVSYLREKEAFRNIPVIMDKAEDRQPCQDPSLLMRLFDDVVDARKADHKLVQRIQFLERVKQKSQQKSQEKMDLLDVLRSRSKLAFGRRLFDICISLVAILLTLPLMAMIAVAIKLESKGPVLYISKRAGRGYKVFNFLKFRTMQFDADKKVDQLKHLNAFGEEKEKVFFKVANDPRTTRIGKLLRNTSLDELPQFFNVLLGDMSLVGNRPLPLYEASMLTTDEWSIRFMAPAGITGLWQIRKKDRHCMTTEERIKLDIAYSQKQNFLYDLWIIAQTPPALIQKSNA